MTFILVPSQGEDLQVNAWNWRPTLELLLAANVIPEDDHELMGANGCGGEASDAFHLVIPSMAGYGFSGKPTETGWDTTRMPEPGPC